MKAVDEIGAAVAKLSMLKAASRPAPWTHQPFGGQNQNGDYCGGDIFEGDGEYLISEVSDADGALIVTLHRAIDAQLAFLGDHHFGLVHTTQAVNEYALDLARAINGTV